MKNKWSKIGFWLGLASSAAQLFLWLILAYRDRFYPMQITPDTWMVNTRMIGLALGEILAAWLRKPLLMLIIFLVSFYPVGFYMLGVPSLFRWIGISNLFYLAAILILVTDWCLSIRLKSRKGESSYGPE